MKKIVKLMLSVMMIASMAACSSAPKNDQGGEGKFKAGTYTGTAQGNNGDVTVEVTLSADKIEKVEVTEHKESAGISDAAIANIPASIVESQSLNVDTVSGATHTSDAILDAVKAALTEAGADIEALLSGEGAAKTTVTLED